MSKHYHFIGIGGIGVGALAALSLDKGCTVSGSDTRSNHVTKGLQARGAEIFLGHAAENIRNADYVVFSSAIQKDNPELSEARRRQIPVLRRAELLAELMEGYTGITVAGAHGKTTTTSMVANLLMQADLSPTVAIGGIVTGTQFHAKLGEGEHFVAEADESDGSFLHFAPRYSIITNIDFEHVDYYRDWAAVLKIYETFIGKTLDNGTLFIYGEDARLLKLAEKSGRVYRTYGFTDKNDLYAQNISFDRFQSHFDVSTKEKKLGRVILNVPGRHNVANALAVISLGLELSIDFDVIGRSFAEYSGVQRRFQLKGHINDIWVIDDYAHHPTEIRATLDAARIFLGSLRNTEPAAKNGKVIAIFQPHRYSRVQGLFEDFAASLADCDHLIITDIYAASEEEQEGVTAEKLCEAVRGLTDKPVDYLPKGAVVDGVLNIVRPGDVLMTLGAGDITGISNDLVEALNHKMKVNI